MPRINFLLNGTAAITSTHSIRLCMVLAAAHSVFSEQRTEHRHFNNIKTWPFYWFFALSCRCLPSVAMSGLHLHYSSAIFFLYLFLSLFVYLRTPQFDAAHKVTKIISIRRENDVPASTEIEHKNLIAKLFRSRLNQHCVYTLFH